MVWNQLHESLLYLLYVLLCNFGVCYFSIPPPVPTTLFEALWCIYWWMSVRQISSDVDSLAKNPTQEHLQLTLSCWTSLVAAFVRTKRQHRTRSFGLSPLVGITSGEAEPSHQELDLWKLCSQKNGSSFLAGRSSFSFRSLLFPAARTSTKLSGPRSQSSYLSQEFKPTCIQTAMILRQPCGHGLRWMSDSWRTTNRCPTLERNQTKRCKCS